MAIITLTTDWGQRDYFVAELKGRLISLSPDVRIVDISHDINHFDILQASYILKNCFDKFPAGTIHFIVMRGNKRAEHSNGYLLLKCLGHYFIGFDSGVFYLTLGDEEKEIYRLDISTDSPGYIVSGQLCKVIAALIEGKKMEALGEKTDDILKVFNAQPTSDRTVIRGSVIHIDSFHNIISNITKDLFEKVGQHRPFTISIRNHNHRLLRLHKNYDDADESELVIMFNEKGNLKIALNRSKAASLLGLKLFDTIRIEFDDNENS